MRVIVRCSGRRRRRRRMTGKPIAAMVWVMANVATKPSSWIETKIHTLDLRSRLAGG